MRFGSTFRIGSGVVLGGCLLSGGATSLAATPKETLILGWEAAPKSGDPRFVGGDANAQYAEELRFLPLASFNENGELLLLAAQSIDSPDGKVWSVQVRKGIKFANGKEMTADDVLATYERVLSETATPPSARKGHYSDVEKIEKVGKYELKFTLKAPTASFRGNLVVGILPKEAADKAAPEDVNGKGYESGPYIAKVTSDTEWVLERNEKFSAKVVGLPAPKLPRVVFKIITDDSTRYAALVKGDLDMVQGAFPPDKISEVKKSYAAKFNVETRPQINTTVLAFNLKDPTFKNVKVREAIAKAVDRDEILQYIVQGLGIPATGMFPPKHYYADTTLKPISYDPEGAMKLLDEAGFKDPDGNGPQPRLRFTMKVNNGAARIAIAKAIAGQLKRVGLQMDTEILEFGTFRDQLSKGNIPIWLQPWTGFKDPDILEFVFHSKKIPPEGANRGFYVNPEVDKLLDEGRTAMKPEARRDAYLQVQKIVDREKPYVFLWHGLGLAVMSKQLKGHKQYADGRYLGIVGIEKL